MRCSCAMLPRVEPLLQDPPAPKKGLRQTEQRKAVFEALMEQTDHPSAVDVFMRVKNRMPSISLATVYNCLEALTDSGLVRTVNHEREPSRFCANLAEHAHLFCTQCGSVTDLPLHTPMRPEQIWNLPPGVSISEQEVSFHGICAKCAPSEPYLG
jgi:Fe2+ or Zn2+ uptake regulation protein